ncbi:HD domain-containing protein [Arcanobacterium buesumense]|uniref:HD domain-containing protein n=1 Tax=Arcanobacterium buesumense TaxID=2722751 RepID=A0A6H2ELZ0_9ACTO|nr:HD domain-containing protein [Arcanobacterium buesumense]QJC22090.1 HD domain-containing protein [Arcanobacterium buesumense]
MSTIDLTAIQNYTYAIYNSDRSGHGLDHINRVVSLCQRIIADTKAEGMNPRVILIAAYVHDVIDPKVVADPVQARNDLEKFLHTQALTGAEITEILHIISNMSFSKNLITHQPLSINGQIVQDADRLDAIGAIGIGRAFYYGGKFGDDLYDPARAPRDFTNENDYREHSTVINHFHEKLFKLTDSLNTQAAKRIGELRNKRMCVFVEQFIAEWNGEP